MGASSRAARPAPKRKFPGRLTADPAALDHRAKRGGNRGARQHSGHRSGHDEYPPQGLRRQRGSYAALLAYRELTQHYPRPPAGSSTTPRGSGRRIPVAARSRPPGGDPDGHRRDQPARDDRDVVSCDRAAFAPPRLAGPAHDDFCRTHQADGNARGRAEDRAGPRPLFLGDETAWLLEQDPAAHGAEAGQLAAGTIDNFLLSRLTGRHGTRPT